MEGMGLSATDSKGAQVLQWASTQGHTSLVSVLVERYGMDVAAQNRMGGGSVAAAATMGHARVLDFLRRHGAELKHADSEGLQPLHFAAGHGHLEATTLLLEHVALPGGRSKSGHFPVDLALGNGHASVAKILQRPAQETHHKQKSQWALEL